MASLAAPHWEAVVLDTRQLLQELGGLPDLDPFYLAGGTGLLCIWGIASHRT